MDTSIIVAVCAVLLSLVTMLTQSIGLRNKARTTTTDMLTAQLNILRIELAELKIELTECHRNLLVSNGENEKLMRRLSFPDENQAAKVLEIAAERAGGVLATAADRAENRLMLAADKAVNALSVAAKDATEVLATAVRHKENR